MYGTILTENKVSTLLHVMLDSMIITTAVVLHTSCSNFKTNLHLQTKDQRINVLENQNNKVLKYNRNNIYANKIRSNIANHASVRLSIRNS